MSDDWELAFVRRASAWKPRAFVEELRARIAVTIESFEGMAEGDALADGRLAELIARRRREVEYLDRLLAESGAVTPRLDEPTCFKRFYTELAALIQVGGLHVKR